MDVYNLDKISSNLLLDYSVIGQNSTRIVFRFNGWWNVTCAITQVSTKNPLLFNIFGNDMFLCVSRADICNFAENNYVMHRVTSSLIQDVLYNGRVNSLKSNPGKFQFMILRANTGSKVKLSLDGNKVEKSQEVSHLRKKY